MGKRYTLIASIFAVGAFMLGLQSAQAQSFRIEERNVDITITGLYDSVGVAEKYAHITNLTGAPITLEWRMLSNDADTASGDGFSLCDNKNCYFSANMPNPGIMDTFSHSATLKYGFEQKARSAQKTSIATFIVKETGTNFYDTVSFTVTRLTTGIAERENALQFTLYPNPSRTVLAVQSDDVMKGYSIHDVSGRLVLSGSFSNFQKEIAVDGLAFGLYTLRLVNVRGEAGSRLFVKE